MEKAMLGWLCGRVLAGGGLAGGFGAGDVLVNGESDVIRQSLGQVVIGGDAFQCGFLVMRQSDIGDFGQVFVLHGYSVSDSLTNAITLTILLSFVVTCQELLPVKCHLAVSLSRRGMVPTIGSMSVLRGDRVLIERRRLDMKQETLANMVGVNRSYISQIERDIDVNVGVKTVQALADALGVSVAYLLGASESPLGESDVKVLREMAGDYVTVDVDSDDERRLIRSLIAEFNALPRRAQEAAIEMIRLLRKVEEDERERDNRPPRIIGGAE